jgi:hypothetical protein
MHNTWHAGLCIAVLYAKYDNKYNALGYNKDADIQNET